jgi:hypothetical protein
MLLLVPPSGDIDARELPGFGLDQGIRLRHFIERMGVDITPDGELVAVAMESREDLVEISPAQFTKTGVSSDARGSEIWLCNTPKWSITKLTGEHEPAWVPRWSPDRTELA